ncbi:F-box-like domain superfamily [Arabidopsis thaliana x Arabidopsis arenosa]|uniref:F-box-like domain superfamily n=2 Tax=Arabidopsis TaxID=3701 RepID=A0A8T2GH16_ARASU|nr:F-box-like domain superfamily [Arabidopsis thaliana x Arabidopsis arenosa]KAG7642991.1 F-box-like domain superfamily [Arabidopsis suecica]
MEKMSDLPRELVEEILSRVPVKSMREVRVTCKTWNALSKHIGKAEAAREGEFLGIAKKKFCRNSFLLFSIPWLRVLIVVDFSNAMKDAMKEIRSSFQAMRLIVANYDIATLSAFGEEQLAVLFQPFEGYVMEIWVTTKIEPSAVSS